MAVNYKPITVETAEGTKPGKGDAVPVKLPYANPNPPNAVPLPGPVQPQVQTQAQSTNEQIWGAGGSGYDGYLEQVEREKEWQNQYDTINNGYTANDMETILSGMGMNPNDAHSFSQSGQYIYDGGDGLKPGTGEKGWTLVEGVERPVAEGASGADERFLSDGAYAYVQHCKEMYAKAKTDEERAYWHAEAEKTRAAYGYSGGVDGSMYITSGALGAGDKNSGAAVLPGELGGGSSGNGGTSTDLKGMLDAWQQAALNQSNGQIDYAVAKAVAELQRALEDAQPQFKEQAESVDLSARQAMDNSALYAEMRGDKGGIGQEQYNSIQNTAAQNRFAVQQAQTKLATDTARQIADLRAQGQFEKADAALELAQSYLTQLVSIEKWAAEFDLSRAEFEESVRQWEAEYSMALQKMQLSHSQWQAEFDADQKEWLASLGEALLSAGVMPSAAQLEAMEMEAEQADSYLILRQLEAARR